MLIVCVKIALSFEFCESSRLSLSRGHSSKVSRSRCGLLGGGSKRKSSGCSGWIIQYSQPVRKKSGSSTIYEWIGRKTQTVPKPSAPVGTPPSYPGLQNRPVNSYNNPPAYSPSWRATTRAPYFENKQPGSESVLPAAAVLRAATAFVVYSLLPLNVPNGKPILSCNATELQQIKINFDGSTYGCLDKTVTVSCFRVDPITNGTMDFCPGKTLECDKTSDIPNISCTNGTLLSSESIFCNSTTIINGINVNDTTKILNCYVGTLPSNIAGSIPTQAPGTDKSKPLSIGSYVNKFLLWLMEKSDILEMQMPTTTPVPESFVPRFLSDNDTMATVSNETTTE